MFTTARGAVVINLTTAQWAELRRLAAGPQNTYGSARTCVQNNLVRVGLAQFFDIDDEPVGRATVIDLCKITAAGRVALADADALRPPRTKK